MAAPARAGREARRRRAPREHEAGGDGGERDPRGCHDEPRAGPARWNEPAMRRSVAHARWPGSIRGRPSPIGSRQVFAGPCPRRGDILRQGDPGRGGSVTAARGSLWDRGPPATPPGGRDRDPGRPRGAGPGRRLARAAPASPAAGRRFDGQPPPAHRAAVERREHAFRRLVAREAGVAHAGARGRLVALTFETGRVPTRRPWSGSFAACGAGHLPGHRLPAPPVPAAAAPHGSRGLRHRGPHLAPPGPAAAHERAGAPGDRPHPAPGSRAGGRA